MGGTAAPPEVCGLASDVGSAWLHGARLGGPGRVACLTEPVSGGTETGLQGF